MLEPIFRYSVVPPPPGISVPAWNLAWLSHDVEHSSFPYEKFMRDVEDMLAVGVKLTSGRTFEVRAIMAIQAESAALLMQSCRPTPLMTALGPERIKQVWTERGKQCRINHPIDLNASLDWPLRDLDVANEVLNRFRVTPSS